ncbi:MAG: hypothetical protein ACXWC9_02560 [Pseudobdellovibrionaceae bacterium]
MAEKRPSVFRIIQGSRGNLIFPMVMAIGITAFSVSYYYYNAFLFRKLEDQKLVHVSQLTAYEYSIKALLNSQAAFIQSAQLPANGDFWSCLNDPEFDCAVATEQNFALLNETGAPFNDTTLATAGIDSAALPCNTFPSITCPFRYELKWSRECIGLGPCQTPDLFIRGQLILGDLPSVKFNINAVNFTFQTKVR